MPTSSDTGPIRNIGGPWVRLLWDAVRSFAGVAWLVGPLVVCRADGWTSCLNEKKGLLVLCKAQFHDLMERGGRSEMCTNVQCRCENALYIISRRVAIVARVTHRYLRFALSNC